jgi:chemotaxis protein methyltransferase CheR
MMAGGVDRLRAHDFRRLAKFIQDYSGIKMPATKQTMVEGRLRKRVEATGVGGFVQYCRYVFDEGGMEREAVHLIDVMTTNKTEFFREPDHFKFLADTALPRMLSERKGGPATLIKAWSTASSIGAEPYTMAMVMDEVSQRVGSFRISIVATDISTRVLETAAGATYPEAMVAPVPLEMRKRYLLRGRNGAKGLVRVVPELRRMVQFGRLNLMDAAYPVDQDMDLIFCRNMLIYFDKPTQQAVLTRLCDHLRSGGCLFLGHSESLAGFGLPLDPIAPTVFRRE